MDAWLESLDPDPLADARRRGSRRRARRSLFEPEAAALATATARRGAVRADGARPRDRRARAALLHEPREPEGRRARGEPSGGARLPLGAAAPAAGAGRGRRSSGSADEESLAYFRTRARTSRLGAWASPQSRPLADRDELDARYAEAEARFDGEDDVPLPPFWGGYRLVPEAVELWQNRPSRLHDRARYERDRRRLVAREAGAVASRRAARARALRVEAAGVPEQEALRALEARRAHLLEHLLRVVVPVLDPRDQLHAAAPHLALEVDERPEHGLARLGARARRCRAPRRRRARDTPSGARGRRAARSSAAPARCPCRGSPRARRAPSRRGRRAAPSRCFAYATKLAISSPFGTLVLPGIDGVRDVAVGREPDVVEHDLVEAGARSGRGDRDGVVPHPPVVRVDPGEPGARRPDRPVRCGGSRSRGAPREVRVLEDDDPADQVDALAVQLPDDLSRVVVATHRARLRARAASPVGAKAISPPSSLTSSSIVLSPYFVSAHVLVELARERGERAGHVDAAHLDRQRPRPDRDLSVARSSSAVAASTPASRAAFSLLPASVIPPASASTASSRIPTTAARRRRRFGAVPSSRRARKRSFGSSDGYNMDTGSRQCRGCLAAVLPARGRSTIRRDGALRPRHPAADRGGPDRHRPVRPGAHAAVEPRRPLSTASSACSGTRATRTSTSRPSRRSSRSSSRSADDEPFILHPGEFVLGSTLERVTLPDDLVARLEGKSSLGRLGLLIHSTAGFIDPGFDGHVTLELSNVANLPITIYPAMKIGQLSFVQMSEAGGDAVRHRARSARSTRDSAARRRAGTGRTSRTSDDPRHRRERLRRAPRDPRPRRERRPRARDGADARRRSGARRASTASSSAATSPTRRRSSRRRAACGRSSTSSRSSRARPRPSSA